MQPGSCMFCGLFFTLLEIYAREKNILKICLETGNLHISALAFYGKMGYERVESFGNYLPNKVSVYFEKVIC